MNGDRVRARRLAEEVAERFGLQPRRWFGGWSLLRDGRQIAMVTDTVYVRVNDPLRAELDATTDSEPFRYRRGDGREIEVDAYRSVPGNVLDNPALFGALLARAPAAVRPRRVAAL
jgi:TfoX/Sxy family transcriptional regulator of competence genes